MRLFSKSKATHVADDRATIEQKLAECTAQIKAADADLSRLSLQAVKSGDDAEALAALDKLRKLEAQRDLLTAALMEAERVEQAQQKEFQAQQNVTAKRSLAQRSGRFARDAADVTQALTALHNAQERLAASGSSIVALLPAHLRTGARPFHELLSSKALGELVAIESYRIAPQGKKRPMLFGYENNSTGEIRPLTDTISGLVASVREQFDTPPLKPRTPVVVPSATTVEPAGGASDGPTQPKEVAAGQDQEPRGVTPRRGQQPPDSEIIRLTSPGVGLPLPPGSDGEEAAGEPKDETAVVVPPEPEATPAVGAIDYRPLFLRGHANA